MNVRKFVLGCLETNGYLVSDKHGNAIFIDPAAETSIIMDWIKENNLVLKAVLLTHGHIDHVAGLGEGCFSDVVNGQIYVHRGDSEMIINPPKEFGRRFGIEFDGISLINDMKDGDELSFGDIRVKVIETSGHTEGSVCLLTRENEGESVLFSGDTLFAQSVGRTDLPGGNSLALHESLIKLTSLSPEMVVYPGHGPSTTISAEMRSNPFWPRLL